MKKIELLAPAGNMDSLRAAIQAGCDAVYIGGKSFGARAFSRNFSNDEIVEAINYAHLYGVRVYVTVNTLVYDDEVDDFLKFIEFIHRNNVDAVLIQDLGMFDLVRKTFPNLELHASTQMHIHNLDGVKVMEKLGIKRVVLARETSIDDIKKIVTNTEAEIEVFVHGALCISYSGQCLMSSLIGGRSGNRGSCVGSCRLKYDVIDEHGKRLNKFDYPLSMKDLNSLEYVGDLIDAGVSSLKIEGRMKSTQYVYKVVSIYRMAIDSYYNTGKVVINENDILELSKIFNRGYTKGFLNNANNDDVINGYRPNHMGVKVGTVVDYHKRIAKIKLTDNLFIGCGLRVVGKSKDVGISVNEFYINNKLVKKATRGDIVSIHVNDDIEVGSNVLMTLDSNINEKINNLITGNLRKVTINGSFVGKIGCECELTISDGINKICAYGSVIDKSINRPVDREVIFKKLNKIGDTIYKFDNLNIEIDDNAFISLSDLNELRRKAINMLNEVRLYKIDFKKDVYDIEVPSFNRETLLTCLISNKDDYKECAKKYDIIYSDDYLKGTIPRLSRVSHEYKEINTEVLIGEIGGFNKYSVVDTDVSFNVVNSYTVAFLHSLGANRVTLSYELDDKQIKYLIECYYKRYKKYPNLELIVSGYEEVMISKFSLNKYYNTDKLFLRDMFGNKFKVITYNDGMHIYNYKKRDCYNKKYYEWGVNALRFNLK